MTQPHSSGIHQKEAIMDTTHTKKSPSIWSNPSYLQSSFGIFMFFCSWGIWWSFFSRWLTDPTHGLGMTSAQQGEIYSINSLATLIIMFAYGTIQDQLGIKRRLVVVVSAIAACVGPLSLIHI